MISVHNFIIYTVINWCWAMWNYMELYLYLSQQRYSNTSKAGGTYFVIKFNVIICVFFIAHTPCLTQFPVTAVVFSETEYFPLEYYVISDSICRASSIYIFHKSISDLLIYNLGLFNIILIYILGKKCGYIT